MIKILLSFLLSLSARDLIKQFNEGKYETFLKNFYSERKFLQDKTLYPYTAVAYLNIWKTDSALKYYQLIPNANKKDKILEGFAYKLAGELKREGKLKDALTLYYDSYQMGSFSEEVLQEISMMLNISPSTLNDSVLYYLFDTAEVVLVFPFSGDFADLGEEFVNAFKMEYRGPFRKVNEENLTNDIRPNCILIGPLKKSTATSIDSSYILPTIWFLPYSTYIPFSEGFIYSPYKCILEEASYLVNYLVDSLRVQNIALIIDTSWIEGFFAKNFKTMLAQRGKFLRYEIKIDDPFNFLPYFESVDSEKIDIAVIPGLSGNAYPIYSAFRTLFPSKKVIGTSAWLSKILQLPKHMLNLDVVSVQVSESYLIKSADQLESFRKKFFQTYEYLPSEIGDLAFEIGYLLEQIMDKNLAGVLLNMNSLKSYYSPKGYCYNFMDKLFIIRIREGNILQIGGFEYEEGEQGEQGE